MYLGVSICIMHRSSVYCLEFIVFYAFHALISLVGYQQEHLALEMFRVALANPGNLENCCWNHCIVVLCCILAYLQIFLVQIFVRALFDYDPSTDDSISCREAGLAFSAGDILHIMAKDDHNWWQARHWTSDDPSEPLQLAGLIPSPELLEWKTSCSTIERAKRKHSIKIGSTYGSFFLIIDRSVERLIDRLQVAHD